MAIYASFHARGTREPQLATLGAISAPPASLATGQQLFVARAARPNPGPRRPTAVRPPESR